MHKLVTSRHDRGRWGQTIGQGVAHEVTAGIGHHLGLHMRIHSDVLMMSQYRGRGDVCVGRRIWVGVSADGRLRHPGGKDADIGLHVVDHKVVGIVARGVATACGATVHGILRNSWHWGLLRGTRGGQLLDRVD